MMHSTSCSCFVKRGTLGNIVASRRPHNSRFGAGLNPPQCSPVLRWPQCGCPVRASPVRPEGGGYRAGRLASSSLPPAVHPALRAAFDYGLARPLRGAVGCMAFGNLLPVRAVVGGTSACLTAVTLPFVGGFKRCSATKAMPAHLRPPFFGSNAQNAFVSSLLHAAAPALSRTS